MAGGSKQMRLMPRRAQPAQQQVRELKGETKDQKRRIDNLVGLVVQQQKTINELAAKQPSPSFIQRAKSKLTKFLGFKRGQ